MDIENPSPRCAPFADRLVAAFVLRAGSEDPPLILDAFLETSEHPTRDLRDLVTVLAIKCAELSVTYDIWDPERRLDLAKVGRLEQLADDAAARHESESKEAGNG